MILASLVRKQAVPVKQDTVLNSGPPSKVREPNEWQSVIDIAVQNINKNKNWQKSPILPSIIRDIWDREKQQQQTADSNPLSIKELADDILQHYVSLLQELKIEGLKDWYCCCDFILAIHYFSQQGAPALKGNSLIDRTLRFCSTTKTTSPSQNIFKIIELIGYPGTVFNDNGFGVFYVCEQEGGWFKPGARLNQSYCEGFRKDEQFNGFTIVTFTAPQEAVANTGESISSPNPRTADSSDNSSAATTDFEPGWQYVGHMKNTKFNGYGIFTNFKKGIVYAGMWECGKRQGLGVAYNLTSSNEKLRCYHNGQLSHEYTQNEISNSRGEFKMILSQFKEKNEDFENEKAALYTPFVHLAVPFEFEIRLKVRNIIIDYL